MQKCDLGAASEKTWNFDEILMPKWEACSAKIIVFSKEKQGFLNFRPMSKLSSFWTSNWLRKSFKMLHFGDLEPKFSDFGGFLGTPFDADF